MNIQRGIRCTNQELYDQTGAVLDYSFLGFFIKFVVYVIVEVAKSKK
jgi:hypothetical protein